MSAPYIIPFNFQPVNTVASASGTYTVPAGKYAKVTIINAVLPVLNSNNLFATTNYFTNGNKSTATASAEAFSLPANRAHRFNITTNANAFLYINFSNCVPSSDNCDMAITNVYGSYSYIFRAPSDLSIAQWISTTSNTVTAMSVDFCNIEEVWLKAGDVLTYSAGSIVYTEYNVIS